MKSSGLTFIRIIIAVLAIFAVIVVSYQLYKYNFTSIKIESAIMGKIEDTVSAAGIFFRDEEPIGNKGYTYLDVVRGEGERISAGGTVARVYADQQSAILQKEIRQVELKISTYEEVLNNSGSYQNAAAGIDASIYENLRMISGGAAAGESLIAFDAGDELIINIMKHKIAAGDLVSYDTLLADLRSELAALKARTGSSLETVKSGKSGHFSYTADGLEEQFNFDELEALNVDTFDEKLRAAEQGAARSENEIGKIVYGNTWYVAMKLPVKSTEKLEEKDTVYIRIPAFGTDRIKCTVTAIRKSGGEAVLVLSSAMISGNILALRAEDVRLILNTYSGLQVRQSALRKVDGKDGVFVKVGLLLRYKEVDILYNDGVNALIAYDASANGGLRLYDQVVYKGSDLYDGKAVS